MEKQYDFSGWATRNNLRCSDGRVIMKDAFKHNDGQIVPLVWNHQHDDPLNVLGHALLKNMEEGTYAYCKFNSTESGQTAKQLVQHRDVVALSIYANQLKQQGPNVLHGAIKEVSLVLAGANPGAYIDSVMQHNENGFEVVSDELIIYSGEMIDMQHSEEKPGIKPEENKELENKEDTRTVKDVFDTLNEEQKTVVYALIGEAISEDDETEEEEETPDMKHNVFDAPAAESDENVLSHAELKAVIDDWKRFGSLKESAIQHGITDIEYLFPDAKNVTPTPTWIDRDQTWVGEVMAGVHNSPFSRIKSMHADITAEDARAKGYIKGKEKVDEVFTLLKRTTTPQTVYKKQKLDRDDVVDIVDFDVIAWMKGEMRGKLNEELARAFLIGDGRLNSADDKIKEDNIRPIWKDDDLYSVKVKIEADPTATADDKAKATIRAAIKARKNYKGSGNPTFYTTEDVLTDMLLLEDAQGRVIYDTIDKLTTALRVRKIVTVAVMEGQEREVAGKTHELLGIIVNLKDYTVGADKGGAINMFDDFDIDYNQMKYLIETRCSGALTVPHSALVLEFEKA